PASLALCSGPVLLPTALIGLSILSLHDALPISAVSLLGPARVAGWLAHRQGCSSSRLLCWSRSRHLPLGRRRRRQVRSDEFSSLTPNSGAQPASEPMIGPVEEVVEVVA